MAQGASVHADTSELFYVIEGSATMLTGGKLVGDPAKTIEGGEAVGVGCDFPNRTRPHFVASAAVASHAQTGAPARPQHAILIVIDGLSYLAPERVDMPNLKALMARGTYFRESYSVVPQHPHSGEWAANYDSSIPNPILVSGTIFLRPDQAFVQSAFFPLKFTAHIANELTYKAINRDFHFTFQAGGNEFHAAHGGKRVDDDENMFWTLTVLRRWKPVYMRVHLQDPGAHLGRLIAELKQLGMYDSTLIFVTGDHGQTVEGGHPPFAQDAWPMPLVVAAQGSRPEDSSLTPSRSTSCRRSLT